MQSSFKILFRFGAAAAYIGPAPHIWFKVIIRLTSDKIEVEVEAELGDNNDKLFISSGFSIFYA